MAAPLRSRLSSALPCLALCAAWAQTNPEDSLPRDVLLTAKTRLRVTEIVKGQPNYTCSESIERSQRKAGSKRWEFVDTLRLEVALVHGKEMFAWPGARDFEDRDLRDMVGGTIGSGDFGIFIKAVFLVDEAHLQYAGEEERDGRKLIRFNYRVGRRTSNYRLRVNNLSGIAGYEGRAWVDATTFDPVRIEIDVPQPPENLPLKEVHDVIEFARQKIGAGEYVLPLRSEIVLVNTDNAENRNRTTFTRCRQYGAESTLSFEDVPAEVAVPAAPIVVTLAAGVEIPITLTSRISTPESAVGDPFTAEVSHDVKSRKGELLIPKGAKVQGRIVRLEAFAARVDAWLLGLRLEEFSFQNKRGALNASLAEPHMVGTQPGYQTTYAHVVPPEPNQIIVFRNRLDLRPGFAMTWKTQ